MDLNLRILPLQIIENLVTQKCLLPKNKFTPKMRAGNWAKCIAEDGGYSVCQIFPRDIGSEQALPTSCYMDKCVSSLESRTKDKISVPSSNLKSLELLEETSTVAEVQLTFVVTEQFFAQNVEKISLDQLKQLAQHILQPLYLVNVCRVQHADLFKAGIAAVLVKAVNVCEDNCFYQITDETKLIIADVQLSNSSKTQYNFHKYGFEQAHQDLLDLLQVAKMQKQRKGALRIALNALIVGATGCGKSSLIANFIHENKCNCFRITAANVLGQYPGETEAELRRIFKAAQHFEQHLKPQGPMVILIEDLQLLCPAVKASTTDAGQSMRICAQLLTLVDELYSAANCDIMCLATTAAPDALSELARRPGRFEHEITIPTPNAEVRRQLFATLFADSYMATQAKSALTPELLDFVAKQTQGYVVADLALLLRNVVQTSLRKGERNLSDIVQESLKKSISTSVRATDVNVIKTEHGFETVGGMHKLKRVLEVAVLAGLKQQSAFQRFGLSLPKGVLLYGPPGCAKTTIAKCLATEANMTFIATSSAEVYSPYVGCAEKFIAKMFDTARKNAPCLIFLDEIDSLVGRRALAANVSSDVQIRILSTLLTEMDGIVSATKTAASNHILVVAATNRPDMVDDALLRPGRFDKLIHVPAPDEESRLAILTLHAQRMPFAADVKLSTIAQQTNNYSGADICNLCNEAALQTFKRDFDATQIAAQDFEEILATQKSSLTQQQINWYLEFEKKFLS